jgi:hypothetical protein
VVSVVAVFPDQSDGTIGVTVWLLHFRDLSEVDLDAYEFEPDAVRPSLFWAEASGRFWPYSIKKPAASEVALLAEWALVNNGKPVRRVSELVVRKGPHTWKFRLLSH